MVARHATEEAAVRHHAESDDSARQGRRGADRQAEEPLHLAEVFGLHERNAMR